MKRFWKYLVPIVLAVAVFACAVWYLFVYDRGFTRDMLLTWARYSESQGNHELAAKIYDITYHYASKDEKVAIELAEQFKSIGYYTKAEYTLAKAIADGGSAELYIALCKTYVEQDKLLDAVTMLENIADPVIKEQLERIRPDAPTVDVDPGFYSQYITLNLQASSGQLYVNTEGEYPSLHRDLYCDPIPLNQGETVVYALAVSENGLVSKLRIFGYTVGGIIEEVTFADSVMESTIRTMLGVSNNKTLYTNDLWTIDAFTIPAGVESYEDLALLPYLTSLTIENGLAGQLKYLSNLSQLQSLTLSGCTPTEEELDIIAKLPNLKKLTMESCSLSSIAPLQKATELTYLNLNNNAIRNIDPLANLINLQELNLSHNVLTSLNALATLNNLQELDVSYNVLTSITPICTNTALRKLNISHNTVAELDSIDNLAELTYLFAGYNSLADISAVSKCTKLMELDISNNQITDLSSLSALKAMSYLNFAYNQVSALPSFQVDCGLVHIDGSYNKLSSLEPLKGLQSLNDVYMDYNEKISDVECLATCPVLIKVNVYGTSVKEVSALTDQSIIVNYDPT